MFHGSPHPINENSSCYETVLQFMMYVLSLWPSDFNGFGPCGIAVGLRCGCWSGREEGRGGWNGRVQQEFGCSTSSTGIFFNKTGMGSEVREDVEDHLA